MSCMEVACMILDAVLPAVLLINNKSDECFCLHLISGLRVDSWCRAVAVNTKLRDLKGQNVAREYIK